MQHFFGTLDYTAQGIAVVVGIEGVMMCDEIKGNYFFTFGQFLSK